MNERFGADPCSCDSAFELRHLLAQFGPFSGRFLAQYPDEWHRQVLEHLTSGKPVEQKRVEELLIQAKTKAALLKVPSLLWFDHQSWTENAARLVASQPAKLDGMVVARSVPKPTTNSYSIDDLDLPPTAAERIAALPDEFARVARNLLLVSRELVLVDPYFDLLDPMVANVAQALFSVIAKGRCSKLTCFARADAVFEREGTVKLVELQTALNLLVAKTFTNRKCDIHYALLDDSRSRERMHDRYLLSAYGGVQFGQGFKQLGRGRKVQAEPVAVRPHVELMALYGQGRHDMTVAHRLRAIFRTAE